MSFGVGFLTEDEARAVIRDKLDSREWWCIPWVSQAASRASIEIEATYYDGEANGDLETMTTLGMIPGVFALVFAHKRRMSAVQLAALLYSDPAAAELLIKHDILAIIESPDDERGSAAMFAFNAWVMGDDGYKPKHDGRWN